MSVREQVRLAVTLVEFESWMVPGHCVWMSVSSGKSDVVSWLGHFRVVFYPSYSLTIYGHPANDAACPVTLAAS